jgi:hypothetical protein
MMGVNKMTGYFSNTTQQVIDKTANTADIADKNYFNAVLWDIKNKYDVPAIGDVTQKYRMFKDIIDEQYPTKPNEERRRQALENTRTHYMTITFNKNTPEPMHDGSHDDFWRE